MLKLMMFMFYTVVKILTTNTSMTLYHKVFDKTSRLDKWERYIIKNVMWQGGKGASINKGYEKANDISIYIPYNINDNLTDIPISIGDIVVKGTVENDITKQSDLNVYNYNITTLINNDYGSSNMKHIQIGAK